ncbi:MAG: class I SAM-dependent methyltransferase [Candidatus Eisenbacteria bacterium]|nr:class I SAM-dependent methyltransferase [Candidatus Eisenbacteria bacterium]
MSSYYTEKLSAGRLKLCYDLAPPAVQSYLAAEIEHVRRRIPAGSRVLELGCGYGRALKELAPTRGSLVGIDTSMDSLRMARSYLAGATGVVLAAMDAVRLAFARESFDLVFCIQNGVSAFHVDPCALFENAVGVARRGGKVLFSSYAAEFWEDRLAWFRIQAAHGLVGELDERATGNGVIVCRDGFTATTLSPAELRASARGLGSDVVVETVGGSSVFCEITV